MLRRLVVFFLYLIKNCEVMNKLTKKESSDLTTISASGLEKQDTFELLKLAYYADRGNLVLAFRKIGVIIKNISDIKKLADISRTGNDTKGVMITTVRGRKKRIYADIRNIVKNIQISKPQMMKFTKLVDDNVITFIQ